MTRIAIIGNCGGGKSTLARQLSDTLALPLHPIDHLQWCPGWLAAPREEFASAHAEILAQPRWIIDGWGDFPFIEERLRSADTIVLVDYPLWRHYWWALKRQFACLFRPRPDSPPGCPMLPVTWKLLKMIWAIDRDALPKLRVIIAAHAQKHPALRVYRLRNLRDLSAFRLAVDHARAASRVAPTSPAA